MEQISKVRKCYFCGATLQSDDPNKEGYVNPEVLENPTQNFAFCQKCFEAERFRALSNEPFIDYEFIDVLKEAKTNDCLLVYVVNLFSFETSFSKEVLDLIQGMKIMVVGTKFDLLPKGTNKEDIQEYVAHRFRVAGLRIQAPDVYIVSYDDEDSVRDILTRIFELKNAKNVYVIGSESSGKTQLINSFLKIYSNLSNGNIVTCNYKNTHLKVMQIPMTNRSSMYETPGISITNSILFGLDAKTLRNIYLTEPVEPREISITKGHSVFIGGLAIIELLEGEKLEMTCYFHKNVQLHRSHVSDVESKFIKLNKKGELMPSLSKIKSTKDMEVFDIAMANESPTYRYLGFSGLGWVNMKASDKKLRVYVPKGVSIYTSRPKIKK